MRHVWEFPHVLCHLFIFSSSCLIKKFTIDLIKRVNNLIHVTSQFRWKNPITSRQLFICFNRYQSAKTNCQFLLLKNSIDLIFADESNSTSDTYNIDLKRSVQHSLLVLAVIFCFTFQFF